MKDKEWKEKDAGVTKSIKELKRVFGGNGSADDILYFILFMMSRAERIELIDKVSDELENGESWTDD